MVDLTPGSAKYGGARLLRAALFSAASTSPPRWACRPQGPILLTAPPRQRLPPGSRSVACPRYEMREAKSIARHETKPELRPVPARPSGTDAPVVQTSCLQGHPAREIVTGRHPGQMDEPAPEHMPTCVPPELVPPDPEPMCLAGVTTMSGGALTVTQIEPAPDDRHIPPPERGRHLSKVTD